jgi:CSLREA domain-containing protein
VRVKRGPVFACAAVFAAVVLPLSAGARSASGTTITVNSLADTVVTDGACTLREAIMNANANSRPNHDCVSGAGNDKIVFSVAGTIVLAGSELPAIKGGLKIDGANAITVSGDDVSRILETLSGADLTLKNLTLTHGFVSADYGGAIYSAEATLNLDNVTLSNNVADNGYGGAVAGGGPLKIVNSSFDHNTAYAGGALLAFGNGVTIAGSSFTDNDAAIVGAIYLVSLNFVVSGSTISGNTASSIIGGAYVSYSGTITNTTVAGNVAASSVGGLYLISDEAPITLDRSSVVDNTAGDCGGGLLAQATATGLVTVQNSTIAGNAVSAGGGGPCTPDDGAGGGVWNNIGKLVIANSTIANNSASDRGGGILVQVNGALTLLNATVAGNFVDGAAGTGGIANDGGVSLANTIVAGNNDGDADTDCGGGNAPVSNGHNIDGDGTCNLGASGDQPNTDPDLGPLQDNGGPTETMMPGPLSPAIDTGDTGICVAAPVSGHDQRGVARPQGKKCDIGAVEATEIGVLYGARGGPLATSDLFTIDSSTGTGTSVGAIGYAVTGLAFDPTSDQLYGVTSRNSGTDPSSLITIDRSTGAGTLVGSLGGCCNVVADIAFDSSGQLYGWGEGPDDLVRIDRGTGLATVVGDSKLGSFGDAMSFDKNGKLYVAPRGTGGKLYTASTSTGKVTSVITLAAGPFGSGYPLNAGAFACDGTTFFASNGSFGAAADLVTVNTKTGAINTIGSAPNNLDALAWLCPPLAP